MVKSVRILFEIFIAVGRILSFGLCTYLFIYLFIYLFSFCFCPLFVPFLLQGFFLLDLFMLKGVRILFEVFQAVDHALSLGFCCPTRHIMRLYAI